MTKKNKSNTVEHCTSHGSSWNFTKGTKFGHSKQIRHARQCPSFTSCRHPGMPLAGIFIPFPSSRCRSKGYRRDRHLWSDLQIARLTFIIVHKVRLSFPPTADGERP